MFRKFLQMVERSSSPFVWKRMQMVIVMLTAVMRTILLQVRDVLLADVAPRVGVGVLRWVHGGAAPHAQTPPTVKKVAENIARIPRELCCHPPLDVPIALVVSQVAKACAVLCFAAAAPAEKLGTAHLPDHVPVRSPMAQRGVTLPSPSLLAVGSPCRFCVGRPSVRQGQYPLVPSECGRKC